MTVVSTTDIYTLSLHDALPIYAPAVRARAADRLSFLGVALDEDRNTAATGDEDISAGAATAEMSSRSEEHTSELQSLTNIVCRLLLEKKNIIIMCSIVRSTS